MPIQNLSARLKQIGRDIGDEFEQRTVGRLKQSANISVNALTSSVEGAVDELQGAVDRITDPIENFFGGIFGGNGNGATNGGVGADNSIKSSVKKQYTGGPIKNPLSSFASYNCVFTLGVLSNTELAHPDSTYRLNGPEIVILRSGGTGSTGQVKTTIEKQAGITGEYYIDDVEVESIIAPSQNTKQTNATSLKFMVHEPYSMGIFLQSLYEAALQGGHKNYIDAPFLLDLDFVGWDDMGNTYNVPRARRMFPLKFTNITFNVTAGGSVYTVEAIPWNEQALSDETQTVKEDFDIKGSTIAELLQTGPESLAALMNSRELALQGSGNKSTGDQYVLLFPNERASANEGIIAPPPAEEGATTASQSTGEPGSERTLTDEQKQKLFDTITGISNGDVPQDFDAELSKLTGTVIRRSNLGESFREYAEKSENANDIGRSKISKSYLDGKTEAFGRPAFVEETTNTGGPPNVNRTTGTGVFKRGRITISDDGQRINFKKGTRVQDVIEELVLLSEYGRQFATQSPDEKGNKTWFKIDTQVYNVTDSANTSQTGKDPKIFVYRVVPYEVNSSKTNSPTQPTKGISNLKKQAMKEYNYIYTGKNDDIINFNIDLNYTFFTAIQSDLGQNIADTQSAGKTNIARPTVHPIYGTSSGRNDVVPSTGTPSTQGTTRSRTGSNIGGTEVHPETQVARTMNDAIVNSDVDLVMAEMDIWGDPYYIADSGMGNYNAGAGESANIDENGAMDYQYGEVDVLVNFRTPIDIGKDGQMQFPELGTQVVGQFSGLYQVTMVRNKISQNKFTQMLTMLRRKNQEQDTIGKPVDQNAEAVTEQGERASINTGSAGSAGVIPEAPPQTDNELDADSADNGAGDGAAAQSANSITGTGGTASPGTSSAPTSPPAVQGGRGNVVEGRNERAQYAQSQSIRARLDDRDQAGRIRGGL
mgnify:CR=1 FL=1